MAMNIHVSTEWMLIGGWNHQYAPSTMMIARMASKMMVFLLLGPSKFSTNEKSMCGVSAPPPPFDPAPAPADEEAWPCAFPTQSVFTPDCLSASRSASMPDVCFTGILSSLS